MSEEEKQSDVEVMFPEQEVYGVKVRPWTFNQFISILPEFARVRKELKVCGIGLDDLDRLKDGTDEDRLEFLVKVLPLIPAVSIVSMTTGISREEVEGWEFDKTSSIFLIIIIQNAGRVKNFFGLGLTAVRALRIAG